MGIYYDKRRGNLVARGSTVNGKRKHLGSFKRKIEAELAFNLHESKVRHAQKEAVTQPLELEQIGDKGRFSSSMMNRLKTWAMSPFQKRRTDGSRRDV